MVFLYAKYLAINCLTVSGLCQYLHPEPDGRRQVTMLSLPSSSGHAFLNNPTLPGTRCFGFDVAVKRLSHQTNKWTAEPADTRGWRRLVPLAQLQTSQWGGWEEGSRWLIDCNVRVSKLALTDLNVSRHYKWEQKRNKLVGLEATRGPQGTVRNSWGSIIGKEASTGKILHPAPLALGSCPWLGPFCSLYFLSDNRILT